MSEIKTSHYECYSDSENIMIYGINVEELYPQGIAIFPEINDEIHSLIPDVMEKCQVTPYAKKGVVLFSPYKELLHIR